MELAVGTWCHMVTPFEMFPISSETGHDGFLALSRVEEVGVATVRCRSGRGDGGGGGGGGDIPRFALHSGDGAR